MGEFLFLTTILARAKHYNIHSINTHIRMSWVFVCGDCGVYYVIWKILWLKISYLWRKCVFRLKKFSNCLVSSQKSSTFAADFAMNASERLNIAKGTKKNVMLKISHLQRKCKKYWKKLLKNLVSPKKSSTFAADFATNENLSEKIVIFESLINQ